MFVASRVYKYATGAPNGGASGSTPSSSSANPSDQRVKRNPKKRPTGPGGAAASQHGGGGVFSGDEEGALPTSPPPSYASVASGSASSSAGKGPGKTAAAMARDAERVALIDRILKMESLYEVLGVKRNAKPDEIRRGFLARSRVVHPDKMPDYAPCIPAFQKLSFAYQTLSNPTSRRMYDVSGRSDLAAAVAAGRSPSAGGAPDGSDAGFDAAYGGDETLNGVLYNVFCEFLEGDFEMIRVLINAMNEGNSGLNLGDEAIDSIEGVFRRIREALLAGKKYLAIVRFELMRLYEIQHSLRQLSYFDVFGRLRLTLQLARVTLSIPMRIDHAMKDGEGEDDDDEAKAKEDEGSAEEDDSASSSDEDGSQQGGDDGEEGEARRAAAASGAYRRRRAANGDFGVAQEETDEEDDEAKAERLEGERRERRRQRRRERRARAKEARRRARARVGGAPDAEGQDEEEEQEDSGNEDVKDGSPRRPRRRSSRRRRQSPSQQQSSSKDAATSKALQKKGLLGPTAAALLNGVVKVLETSENWVPGKKAEVEE